MSALTIALVNLKPGTAKTTSAVWLAHAFHEMGHPVLLVDSDPAASALEWSDLAADAGHRFPFRLIGLPSRDVHTRLPEFAKSDDVVIIDTPQMEDHAGITRSCIRIAHELVITVAPNGIELNRMAPVRQEIEDMATARRTPARISVLLNRVDRRSASGPDTRDDLRDDGYDVLNTMIPLLQLYSQSFGGPVKPRATAYALAAEELLSRHKGSSR